ncbi:nitroreductase [Moritella sp. F3]|uniref:nitroreductase family protein n=1 Tax=Moritella sp. F3 TaxID=2718882 RepID=UPI0018E17AE7|nr:nitroreductase [Moritella sp. F3]GIC76424.1 nitroreductase [Moritella sp. F1]GIC80907.1 nitroreductase [Moritella sp. F3]
MPVLDFIYQRSSCHVHEMCQPAPDNVQLKRIFQAVMSAPDHGNLRPWHLVVVANEQVPSMCELMCEAWLEDGGDIDPAKVRRLTNYLGDAPMVVVVSANITSPHAVSRRDQVLSAAAACQNILLAAEQQDIAAVWYSTDAAELPRVQQLFGLTQQQEPVAFIMLGTKKSARVKPRGEVDKHCYQWQGDGKLTPLFTTEENDDAV